MGTSTNYGIDLFEEAISHLSPESLLGNPEIGRKVSLASVSFNLFKAEIQQNNDNCVVYTVLSIISINNKTIMQL
jgi:hypothetical protein